MQSSFCGAVQCPDLVSLRMSVQSSAVVGFQSALKPRDIYAAHPFTWFERRRLGAVSHPCLVSALVDVCQSRLRKARTVVELPSTLRISAILELSSVLEIPRDCSGGISCIGTYELLSL